MKPIRVLLVTRESLRRDRNEGSVLLNLFEDLPAEYANICCKSEPPDNDLCSGRYFCMTDRMAVKKLLRGVPMGEVAGQKQQQGPKDTEYENKSFYDFFRNHNWNIFYILQDILWGMAGVQSPKLDRFISDFKPDIVFAPLTPYWYANRLQNTVIRRAGVPAVTYLYDDIYSLKQYSLSLFYWLRRFAVRRSIRENLPLYSFAYTMTEQQKHEYERVLHISMRILRKCDLEIRQMREPHTGVCLIYAGGIYYGRDRTLVQIADAVRTLRAEGADVRLTIYTPSPLKKGIEKRLNDGTASFVHPAIPADVLAKKYAQSDIALHVESFRKKDALVTRLSFSTKIVDCLASGCAVLAICPEINAGWQYLKEEGAALCVSDPGQIGSAVRKLVTNADERQRLAGAARNCIEKNHNTQAIKSTLFNELVLTAENGMERI